MQTLCYSIWHVSHPLQYLKRRSSLRNNPAISDFLFYSFLVLSGCILLGMWLIEGFDLLYSSLITLGTHLWFWRHISDLRIHLYASAVLITWLFYMSMSATMTVGYTINIGVLAVSRWSCSVPHLLHFSVLSYLLHFSVLSHFWPFRLSSITNSGTFVSAAPGSTFVLLCYVWMVRFGLIVNVFCEFHFRHIPKFSFDFKVKFVNGHWTLLCN